MHANDVATNQKELDQEDYRNSIDKGTEYQLREKQNN